MLLKQKIKPEYRMQILTALGPIAWLALILSIFLGRTGNPTLDFAQGFLIGISIVGNLAYIFVVTRHMKRNRRQQ
jgi:Ca2+/H+ antiporter